MAWNILEGSAVTILGAARTDVGEYTGKFNSLDTALTALRTALPNSTLVREGITELDTEVVDPARSTVTNRSGSAVSGTSEAVRHYQDGHYDMAANSQRSAASMPNPDMPAKAGPKTTLGVPGYEPGDR